MDGIWFDMIQTLSTLLIGYSVFSAIVIVILHMNQRSYSLQSISHLFGIALLLVLGAMQLFHYAYLQHADDGIHEVYYRVLLFSVAPMFYLFGKPLLKAESDFSAIQLVHLLPLVIAPVLAYDVALPLAFVIGAIYVLSLARLVYALREKRDRFRLELGLLVIIIGLAMLVALAGVSLPLLGEPLFYSLYAMAIGFAFILVTIVLFLTPQLPAEVTEAARETYATSTLRGVDCNAAIQRLDRLMREQTVYKNPALDLQALAQQVELSGHQLSELINTRLGKNVSRYLREYRVAAAQTMLHNEPAASVLSIGLAVGFNSQSAFYDAFREITGMTPGKYRQLHQGKTPE